MLPPERSRSLKLFQKIARFGFGRVKCDVVADVMFAILLRFVACGCLVKISTCILCDFRLLNYT